MVAEDDGDRQAERAVIGNNLAEESDAAKIKKRLGTTHPSGTAGGQDDRSDHVLNSRQGETVRQAERLNSRGRTGIDGDSCD